MGKLKKTVSLLMAATIFLSVFTACGKQRKITIEFESNGGSPIAPVEYVIGQSETVYFDVPEKEHYDCIGWYNSAEMNAASPTWSLSKGSAPAEKYWAKWEATKYEMTLNRDRGVFANSKYKPPVFTVEDTAPARLPSSGDISKRGYSHGGWYDNKDFTGNPVTELPAGSTGDRAFWIKWVPTAYKITYVTGGGTQTEADTYTVRDRFELVKEPAREYYTFGGWYPNSLLLEGERVEAVPEDSIGDKVFYAKWIADEFAIEYTLNGGSWPAGAAYPLKYAYNAATVLVSPEKTGHTFAGWYDNEELSGAPLELGAGNGRTGTLRLYAKWSPVNFLIKYNYPSGAVMPPGYPQGYNSGSGAVLPVPELTGYVFKGWFGNAACEGAQVTAIAAGEEGDREYWSKWETAPFAVSFVMNDYEENRVTDKNDTAFFSGYFSGETKALPAAGDMKRNGYTFGGWYRAEDLTGYPVTHIAASDTGDRTFYAKWTPIQYNLVCWLNGGNIAGDTEYEIKYTPESAGLPPQPVRRGYTFMGWKNADNGAVWQTIPKGTFGNLSLNAIWEADRYALTFMADGGTMPAGHITEYAFDSLTALPVPVKAGYDFGGWSLTPSPAASLPAAQRLGMLMPGSKRDGTPGHIGALTLYALWLAPVTANNTKDMLAVNTNMYDLSGNLFNGSGFSGSQEGIGRFGSSIAGSRGGAYITYTHNPGVHIMYEFTLDRAVSNASLVIGLGSEFASLPTSTFSSRPYHGWGGDGVLGDMPANLAVYVNGKAIDWGSIKINGEGFGQTTVSGLSLPAGKNIITFEVLADNGLPNGGSGAGGPLFDFISITARAVIGWDPIANI